MLAFWYLPHLLHMISQVFFCDNNFSQVCISTSAQHFALLPSFIYSFYQFILFFLNFLSPYFHNFILLQSTFKTFSLLPFFYNFQFLFWSLLHPIRMIFLSINTSIHVLFLNTLHEKGSFPLRFFSVNVTKSAGNCRFGRIYWRNR